jgi:hypothetical protein
VLWFARRVPCHILQQDEGLICSRGTVVSHPSSGLQRACVRASPLPTTTRVCGGCEVACSDPKFQTCRIMGDIGTEQFNVVSSRTNKSRSRFLCHLKCCTFGVISFGCFTACSIGFDWWLTAARSARLGVCNPQVTFFCRCVQMH